MILFYISTIYKYIYSVKNNLKCDIYVKQMTKSTGLIN